MDKYDEKKYIYEQMRLIIEERRRLTELYYDLKKNLINWTMIPMMNNLT